MSTGNMMSLVTGIMGKVDFDKLSKYNPPEKLDITYKITNNKNVYLKIKSEPDNGGIELVLEEVFKLLTLGKTIVNVTRITA